MDKIKIKEELTINGKNGIYDNNTTKMGRPSGTKTG